MAPHLLMLPLEIRHEIFKYALFDGELYVADPVHRHRPMLPKELSQNPNLSLHLICKQLSGELKLNKIPSWRVKVCCLYCARLLCDYLWAFEKWTPWWDNAITIRRHYVHEEIVRAGYSDAHLERHIAMLTGDDYQLGTPVFGPRYEIVGKVANLEGVDVIFYLQSRAAMRRLLEQTAGLVMRRL